MNKNDTFESEHLFFRGIRETDTECLVAWRSNFQIIRYFRQAVPITRESHEQWYKNIYCRNANRFDFIIFEKKTKKAIGTVGVSHIDREKESCEISYMIAEPAFQHKGYAMEAIAAMMKTLREEGICCFYAEVHSENMASRRTIESMKYIFYREQPPFILYRKQEDADVSHTN